MLEHSYSTQFDGPIPVPDFGDLGESSSDSLSMLGESSSPACPSIFSEETDEERSKTSQAPFKALTPRRFATMLQDPSAFGYDEILPLDARFDYEFNGGHIVGARNVRTRSQLHAIYHRYLGKNVCIVIHCEFSQNRGPTLLKLFREYDRYNNEYPHLSYPNLYLLEGGYRRVFY